MAIRERSQNRFVVVDCAALPENLMESMLLGHEKGAFTGAHNARKGLIEQAGNGNAPLIQRLAHTIKGGSGNIGAVALREAAFRVEIAGENGDLVKVGELLVELDKSFEVLKEVLSDLDL